MSLVVLALQGCGGGGGSDGPAIPSTGVSGSVSDAVTGSPIAGVSIQVSKPGSATIISGTTNSGGSYTIPLPNDNGYLIQFSKASYHGQAYDSIEVKGSLTSLNVQLQPFNPGISGIVKDAKDNTFLSGVSIQISKNGSVIKSGSTDIKGSYTISLPNDNGYLIEFSKTGYTDGSINDIAVNDNRMKFLETVYLVPIPPVVPPTPIPGGNVHGTIVDALAGLGVDNVLINFRSGINSTTGVIAYSTTTISDGSYIMDNIAIGNYTLEISKTGYSTSYITATSISGVTTIANATITQIIQFNQIRMVVTWGATPPDLDSHLTGPPIDPSIDNTRIHMFYTYAESKFGSPWPDYVKLDLDDTTNYGPETTTIYQQVPGTYRFSIHDFTNEGHVNTTDLSNSEAQVRVYFGDSLVETFNVPTNKVGNTWTVFEWNGTTITPIDIFSDVGYSPDVK
ncbi:MAG: carboxypeptidase regulatory-like domain-containing protein [Chitinophagaceae bacterium]